MDKSIIFSIIIPTYNRAEIIKETIQSVIDQTFKDFELIIVDDGGTDNTEKIVASFNDPRLAYYKKENAERGAARNYGAKKAKGKYLNFLDSDDLLYPNHLESAFSFTEKNKKNVFFLHYDLLIGNRKKSVQLPKSKIINDELVLKGNFLSCDAGFIERSVFEKHQFSENREMSASEDYDLWLRLAAQFPIYYLPIVTSSIRLHGERSVLNVTSKGLIKRKELLLESIFSDRSFVKKYGEFKSKLYAEAYSYISLHLILDGNRNKGLQFLLKSLSRNPNIIFRKRFWAILKHFFLRPLINQSKL